MNLREHIKKVLKEETQVPPQVLRRKHLIDEMFEDMRSRYKRLFCNYRNPNILLGVLYERTLEDLYHAWFYQTVSDDDWDIASEYIQKYLIDKYEKSTKMYWENECNKGRSLNESDPKVGTGKKPKDSDRRLYTDENPSDTVSVKFRTKQDIVDTLSKESFKSKSHARQSQIINLIHQRLRVALERAKDPEVKKRLRTAFEYIESKKEASKRKTKEMKEGELTERCWKGYTQKGMKTMFGKRYPNCVKKTK